MERAGGVTYLGVRRHGVIFFLDSISRDKSYHSGLRQIYFKFQRLLGKLIQQWSDKNIFILHTKYLYGVPLRESKSIKLEVMKKLLGSTGRYFFFYVYWYKLSLVLVQCQYLKSNFKCKSESLYITT